MVHSVGIDLVEVGRLRQGLKRFGDRYLQRLFTPDEIALLKVKKGAMVVSMAGRFAAKEAVMKALGAFFDRGVYLRDIEVLVRPTGMPYVRLPERLQARLRGKKIIISIAHEKEYAVATAVITDEE